MVPGSHERILSGALCGAVVLSDFTKWASSEFEDGDEISLYKWTARESLPQAVGSLLENPSRAAAIASKGMLKAREAHTGQPAPNKSSPNLEQKPREVQKRQAHNSMCLPGGGRRPL
jgi:spore maturation protein CgeB